MLVQKLRLQRGWSQQQLADLSGLSVRTIQRIERGQVGSTESLKSLASVFEIDFSELQTEPDVDNPNPIPTPAIPSSDQTQARTPSEELLALRHVEKVKRFYVHLIQYVGVMTILVLVNIFKTPHKLWVVWPAVGWGIGLLSQALTTFELLPIFGADWERRQVEKRLGRPL